MTSKETGKSGTYLDITVNFPEDGSKPTAEDVVNSSIFKELLEGGAAEPTIDTTEPELPPETEQSEPEETTPAHTETTSSPSEPDPGIAVE